MPVPGQGGTFGQGGIGIIVEFPDLLLARTVLLRTGAGRTGGRPREPAAPLTCAERHQIVKVDLRRAFAAHRRQARNRCRLGRPARTERHCPAGPRGFGLLMQALPGTPAVAGPGRMFGVPSGQAPGLSQPSGLGAFSGMAGWSWGWRAVRNPDHVASRFRNRSAPRQVNLLSCGKPRGAIRPAVARDPCQLSSSLTVRVRPAGSSHARPWESSKVLASESPPSLYF